MVDLGPLCRCLRPPGVFQGASFVDRIRLRCQCRFCLEKVVVAGNGTAVFPAVSSEQKSWFFLGLELGSGPSLGSS